MAVECMKAAQRRDQNWGNKLELKVKVAHKVSERGWEVSVGGA